MKAKPEIFPVAFPNVPSRILSFGMNSMYLNTFTHVKKALLRAHGTHRGGRHAPSPHCMHSNDTTTKAHSSNATTNAQRVDFGGRLEIVGRGTEIDKGRTRWIHVPRQFQHRHHSEAGDPQGAQRSTQPHSQSHNSKQNEQPNIRNTGEAMARVRWWWWWWWCVVLCVCVCVESGVPGRNVEQAQV